MWLIARVLWPLPRSATNNHHSLPTPSVVKTKMEAKFNSYTINDFFLRWRDQQQQQQLKNAHTCQKVRTFHFWTFLADVVWWPSLFPFSSHVHNNMYNSSPLENIWVGPAPVSESFLYYILFFSSSVFVVVIFYFFFRFKQYKKNVLFYSPPPL